MAIYTWRGSCGVRPSICKAVATQNTACGTLTAMVTKLSCSVTCVPGSRYTPRPTRPTGPTRFNAPQAVSRVSTTCAIPSACCVTSARTRSSWVSVAKGGSMFRLSVKFKRVVRFWNNLQRSRTG